MSFEKLGSVVESTLKKINKDSLLNFTCLTSSIVYICLCSILTSFITFLSSSSPRFEPIIEILTKASRELEMLKKPPEEFRETEEIETETIHYPGRYVKAHNVERPCRNHSKKDQEKQLEEEVRSLKTRLDSQEALANEAAAEIKRVEAENQTLNKEVDNLKTSLSEVEIQNKEQVRRITEQKDEEIKQLQEKITDMELQMNSQTSHWPSSMDRYPVGSTFKNGRNQEYDRRMQQEEQAENGQEQENTKPRRGGRKGHKGYSGKVLDNVAPDRIIKLYPEGIPPEDRDKYKWTTAAVHKKVGIVLKPQVVEYVQLQTKIKGERIPLKNAKGVFPPDAKAETTYGSTFRLYVVVNYTIGLMGMKRISEMIRSQFGVSMSPGTVNNIIKKAGKNLKEARQDIAQAMHLEGQNPECVFTADETSLTVGSKKCYDHVLVGNYSVLHTIAETRGLKGCLKSGVLIGYKGWLVTDFYNMYKKREWKSAFDWAHLTRELRSAACRDASIEWVPLMQKFGYESYKAYHTALENNRPIPVEELVRLDGLYDAAIEKGKKELGKMSKTTQNLLFRMMEYKDGILAHLYYTHVYLTSNAAERQCRQIKRRMDVSGHFDTMNGAEITASALTVIETAKTQKLNPIDALLQVIEGNVDYLATGIRDESLNFLPAPIMTTDRSTDDSDSE